MDWDEDEASATQANALMTALAAAERAYQLPERGGGGWQPSAAAVPADVAFTASAGAAEPVAAAVNEPLAPPARRRRLPDLCRGCSPGPATAGGSVAADENLAPACFAGPLHYVFTGDEADQWCQWLVQDSGVAALGFDIEWRVTYRAGVAPRPVALIQLCYQQPPLRAQLAGGQHCCLLLHVCHSGLPPHLRQLLCSKDILKVGVGSQGDALKLQRDFGLGLQGVVCLSEFANARLVRAPTAAPTGASSCQGTAVSSAALGSCEQPPWVPQRWSLAGLAALLLRVRLDKSQALRCSNWEARPPLSAEQQRYAATDAWASLRVYEALSQLPAALPPRPVSGAAIHAAAAQDGPSAAAPPSGPAAASTEWVPACAVLSHLQPAKAAVYQALVQQGLSVEQVASARGIQPDSGYMAEAITAGLGYSWSRLAVPADALQQVASVCGQLLGRRLRAAGSDGSADAPMDLLQQLLAAGHKLRDLKEQHFEDVSYGHLRLALAHLGRCNPGPWQ